jgi:molybdopterin-binding protein
MKKISARNQLKGKVIEVRKGQTIAHVRVDIGKNAIAHPVRGLARVSVRCGLRLRAQTACSGQSVGSGRHDVGVDSAITGPLPHLPNTAAHRLMVD